MSHHKTLDTAVLRGGRDTNFFQIQHVYGMHRSLRSLFMPVVAAAESGLEPPASALVFFYRTGPTAVLVIGKLIHTIPRKHLSTSATKGRLTPFPRLLVTSSDQTHRTTANSSLHNYKEAHGSAITPATG